MAEDVVCDFCSRVTGAEEKLVGFPTHQDQPQINLETNKSRHLQMNNILVVQDRLHNILAGTGRKDRSSPNCH